MPIGHGLDEEHVNDGICEENEPGVLGIDPINHELCAATGICADSPEKENRKMTAGRIRRIFEKLLNMIAPNRRGLEKAS